jgi:hypothetical protein
VAGTAGEDASRPWHTVLVGHRFCCPAAEAEPGGAGTPSRGGRCCQRLQVGAPVAFVREPGNTRDPHAIHVISAPDGAPLGHLPRTVAAVLAPWLDQGHPPPHGVVFALHGRGSARLALHFVK